jgi:long-chain acyl-CoA synthetase
MLAEIRSPPPRLPRLRILRCSSAALPLATLEKVRRSISPNLHVLYGASEAGPIAAATPDILRDHPTSVGRPLGGVDLQIVDERDCVVPAGTLGYVRVRGAGILNSYLHADPREQSRVFRNGWCYPGDVGIRDETGLLFLKGRGDEVMNFDGIMVGPAEIEAVVARYPGVIDAAAFAVPSDEHQDVPAVAFVASRRLTVDDLARFCGERLGIRTPRVFLQVDEIPRNPMGKTVRRQLTGIALARLGSAAAG